MRWPVMVAIPVAVPAAVTGLVIADPVGVETVTAGHSAAVACSVAFPTVADAASVEAWALTACSAFSAKVAVVRFVNHVIP